jgi:hypothetical protein
MFQKNLRHDFAYDNFATMCQDVKRRETDILQQREEFIQKLRVPSNSGEI